jgi:rhodanese-related sulfurtransferase
VVLLVLAGYVGFKWWERRRFFAALDMRRISVAELHAQLSGGATPVVVDVRSPTAQAVDLHRIPGALHVPLHDVDAHLGTLPRDREIVFYCTCPNEASAAQAARVLLNHGFRYVRPLRGGLDAWIAAGYGVEEIPGGESWPAVRPSPVALASPADTAAAERAPLSMR